ncbi:hypothetical protein BPUTSESOX_1677 [uncultured Gammaproteobacteria bacterium]|jgi:vancomycin permeability regulator SanA|nr:hypothetical protein [uncultured Gammaproteobacteria bacterium]CAC9572684.1 hypothetical protein [uncultured Gammaproteobacteria bacterium]CAC9956858.1 hypothetical protein [uncultured Gammaproteobacteria bacterium]VVH51191.1 hypothetical protein BPUTSESOX_1677 [uncultured Gammaproteobacteria bacterium]
MNIRENNTLITYLSSFNDIIYTPEKCQKLLDNNTLDIALVTVNNDIVQVKQFSNFFAQSNYKTMQMLVKKTQIHLNQQKKIILNFYIHYFKSNAIIGEKSISQHPDLIVVLGCNRPSLDKRISYAIQIANQHPSTPILLSGGGFNINMTEGDYIHSQLKKSGIKNEIILETLSMDTIANALFSKIILRQYSKLGAIKNIEIITSKFHLPRALYYFKTIFNSLESKSSFNFCAQGPATATDAQVEFLSEHELSTELNAMQALSVFNNPKKHSIDDMQSLIELLKNHNLYQDRYDILRILLPHC